MNKQDLIKRLNDIANEMDTFLGDESILTAPKAFKHIQTEVNNLLDDLESPEDELDEDEDNKDEPSKT